MERGSGTRQGVWCLPSPSPFTSASSFSRLRLQSRCWPPQPLKFSSLFFSSVAASWHGRWPSTSRIAFCYTLSPQSSTGFITPARKTLSTRSSGKYGSPSGVVYLTTGGTVLAGALVAYAWYLSVHYCAHHNPTILPASLLKHHLDHHKFARRNYGVTTKVWDRVFGTMLR